MRLTTLGGGVTTHLRPAVCCFAYADFPPISLAFSSTFSMVARSQTAHPGRALILFPSNNFPHVNRRRQPARPPVRHHRHRVCIETTDLMMRSKRSSQIYFVVVFIIATDSTVSNTFLSKLNQHAKDSSFLGENISSKSTVTILKQKY